MTYPDSIQDYYEYLSVIGTRRRKAQAAVKHLLAFGETISTHYRYFRPRDAEGFHEYLLETEELSRATVAVLLGAVTSFYDYLLARGLIASNPFTPLYRVRHERGSEKGSHQRKKQQAFKRRNDTPKSVIGVYNLR
jgi:site-specific recombinase XerD